VSTVSTVSVWSTTWIVVVGEFVGGGICAARDCTLSRVNSRHTIVCGCGVGWAHRYWFGPAAGVLGSALTAWCQLRAERHEGKLRDDELVQSGRQALLSLTQLLTSGTSAIALLGWRVSVQSADERFKAFFASATFVRPTN
jgi:hypothetical protein